LKSPASSAPSSMRKRRSASVDHCNIWARSGSGYWVWRVVPDGHRRRTDPISISLLSDGRSHKNCNLASYHSCSACFSGRGGSVRHRVVTLWTTAVFATATLVAQSALPAGSQPAESSEVWCTAHNPDPVAASLALKRSDDCFHNQQSRNGWRNRRLLPLIIRSASVCRSPTPARFLCRGRVHKLRQQSRRSLCCRRLTKACRNDRDIAVVAAKRSHVHGTKRTAEQSRPPR
jgi:hypothetical protein